MSTRAKQWRLQSRWAAIGAAVAVTMGAGGIGLVNASIGTGDKPVTLTIQAERILDTRIDLGLAGKFADATPRDLQVTGSVPVAPSGTKTVVPPGATSVIVNATVVLPSDPGFLAVRSGDATGAPTTSTVNFFPGTIEPNAATVDLSSAGTLEIWLETASDSGNAHVLVDVVGYTIDHHHDDRYYTESEVDALERVVGVSFLTAATTLPIDAQVREKTTPSCPAGHVAISGGMEWILINPGLFINEDIHMVGLYPDPPNRRWVIQYWNPVALEYNATLHTVCAEVVGP